MLAGGMPLPLDRLPGANRDRAVEATELRALRESFGLTQTEMASLLGVATQTYHRWEAAKIQCQLAALELMRCWAREREATPPKEPDKKPRKRG